VRVYCRMGTPTPIGRSSSSQTVCALQASAASSRAASRGGARPISSPHSSGTAAASASGGAGSGCSAADSGCARAPQDPRGTSGGRVACARRRRRAWPSSRCSVFRVENACVSAPGPVLGRVSTTL
jgi:hypothetical protein